MIAISSFRPLDDSEEVLENQLRAKASWEVAFDAIVYFNEEEPRLASPKTVFIPWSAWPPIKILMEFAGQQDGWSAIINADVVVDPNLRIVEASLIQKNAYAALSRRYQFERGKPLPKTGDVTPHDNGLDWFAGTPEFWEYAANECPAQFKIGKILWDTWLMVLMAQVCGPACYDITPCRTVFHPKHGGRREQNIEAPKDDRLNLRIWPARTLTLRDLRNTV